ncbi:hypothetical protein Acr_00g0045220 [Actinidia rufa]|uniref:DUF4283 domain-containing protein n=1 Tax=Actinidia rufa TaxID=165716 RepID=A0A7J0DKK5_9ERIC|nr:hypothetical protein Acr_00g0045220 [Actinidia rufa]
MIEQGTQVESPLTGHAIHTSNSNTNGSIATSIAAPTGPEVPSDSPSTFEVPNESEPITVLIGEKDINECPPIARQNDSKNKTVSNGGKAESSAMGEAHKQSLTKKEPFASLLVNNRLPSQGSKLEFYILVICTFPIWVQLRNLPLDLWNSIIIGKICSKLGRPLHMDKLTVQRERITYARCLVKVDMAKDLVHSMLLTLPDGEDYEQMVFYENPARFCPHCSIVGHTKASCKVNTNEAGLAHLLQRLLGKGRNLSQRGQKLEVRQKPQGQGQVKEITGSGLQNSQGRPKTNLELEAQRQVDSELVEEIETQEKLHSGGSR